MPLRLSGKWSVGFDSEAICRNVWRIKCNNIGNCGAPVCDRLASSTIDDVEIKRRESCFAHIRNRSANVFWIVRTTQRSQHMWHCRLHTNRDSIHSTLSICAHHLERDVVGVALNSHFGIWCQWNIAYHCNQFFCRHHAGRTAPHEHTRCRDHSLGDNHVDMNAHCSQILTCQMMSVGKCCKRAIVTPLRAKRNVQVDTVG